MTAKILLTGATGTIGRATLRALQNQQHAVRIASRASERARELAHERDDVVEFDFDDAESMSKAFEGIDTFLLLTAFVENSVEQTRAALDAAVAAGVKHVVKLSAAGASKDAPARLVRNHGLGEQSVRDSGLGWTIVRPTFFMDNFVNFQGESLRSQGVFYGAAEDGKIAYVSATDVGRVIAAALSSPGAHQSQVYEVTGAEAFSEAEAARQLSAVLERPVRYENVGTEAFKTSLIDSGMSPFHVEGLVFLEDVKAKGWASGTTDVVKLVTGEAPESFDAFIRRNRDALQSASL